MTAKLAQCSVAQLFSLDYRLAPENPHPAAVEDAVAGYRWLLDQGIAPERMVVAGDSAGGGLTMALLLSLKEAGLPLPGGAILLSPWTDLSGSGASVKANAESCAMFTEGGINEGAAHYIGDGDALNPLISPLFGDLEGLPPILAYASDSELILDDTLRLAERAEAAGVDMETHIWKDQPHVWPMFYPQIPEAAETLAQMGDFVSRQTNVRKRQAQAEAAA
jgi:acetyl esterase/lipase